MRVGLFGRGRLGGAIARAAGPALAWQVMREAPPPERVDVVVDASTAAAVPAHVDWALASGTDLVIAATGWTLPDLEARVGDRIGVLVAPNLALGAALARRFALVLGRWAALDVERDPWLLEHHHRAKTDAPSGTARALAEALLTGCPRKRSWRLGSVAPDELSVAVLRAGTEVGTHTFGVDAPFESFEISHRARSRELFGQGALAAAGFVHGRRGLFGIDDLAAAVLDPLFRFGGLP